MRRNCSPRDYPPDYEHLLLCNGQTISADNYPELVAALGSNVLPNLNGRILQGAETAGKYKEAGLPNITGSMEMALGYYKQEQNMPYPIGATSVSGVFATTSKWGRIFKREFVSEQLDSEFVYSAGQFDASLSNPIYGKSNTVQPPAYTVRYYICYG